MRPSSISRLSFLRILQAARGIRDTKARPDHIRRTKLNSNRTTSERKTNPLRCFPLKANHLGSCVPSSNTSSESVPDGHRPSTPAEFHSKLCHLIRNAKDRVILASLYIGPGGCDKTCPKENELLDAIEYVSSKKSLENPQIRILLDANRSSRPVRKIHNQQKDATSRNSNEKVKDEFTSSAAAVYQRLGKYSLEKNDSQLCLFNVLDFPKTLLPSPLNEVAGVFHLKAYIVDDNLILSGANLSEEYFTDRQDRYMLFINGGGGLVDFYADLVGILCKYASPYRETSDFVNSKSKKALFDSLTTLFDGSHDHIPILESASKSTGKNALGSKELKKEANDVIAYAVPTLQLPKTFMSTTLPFFSDTKLMYHILEEAVEAFKAHTSIRISSAYLNPTFSLMEALKLFGRTGNKYRCNTFLLSAGPQSHGFAPKKKSKDLKGTKHANGSSQGKGRSWIPLAFSTLADRIANTIALYGGEVMLFERLGWTFHAKGLWLSTSNPITKATQVDCKSIDTDVDGALLSEADDLIVAIIGSGNYGARSEDLDLESNCILVLNSIENSDEKRKSCFLYRALVHEWNYMCEYSRFLKHDSQQRKKQLEENIGVRLALPIIKKYL